MGDLYVPAVNLPGSKVDGNSYQLMLSRQNKKIKVKKHVHVGVSKNRGTPKSMVYDGNPCWNGWFGGKPPLFLETSMLWKYEVGNELTICMVTSLTSQETTADGSKPMPAAGCFPRFDEMHRPGRLWVETKVQWLQRCMKHMVRASWNNMS